MLKIRSLFGKKQNKIGKKNLDRLLHPKRKKGIFEHKDEKILAVVYYPNFVYVSFLD